MKNKKPNNKQPQEVLPMSVPTIDNRAEFLQFAQWFAELPIQRKMRNPKAFAKLLKIPPESFTFWKNNIQFWPYQKEDLKKMFQEGISVFIDILYDDADNENESPETELLLALIGSMINYEPKNMYEDYND